MDLHWKNKIKVLSITVISALLISCSSTKKVSESKATTRTEVRTNKTTKAKPYTISAQYLAKVDDMGVIEPINIRLVHKKTIATLTVKNNVITYSLKSKDTSVVKSETTNDINTNTDTSVVMEKKESFFDKLKANASIVIITIVLFLVVIFFIRIGKVLSPI